MEENKQRFYRASRESRDSYEKVAVAPGKEEIELNDDGTGEVELVGIDGLEHGEGEGEPKAERV